MEAGQGLASTTTSSSTATTTAFPISSSAGGPRAREPQARPLPSAAKLRLDASIEDIDFRHPRGLDRGVLLDLARAAWVNSHQDVMVVGPTGVGKTYIDCALALSAIRAGHTALYVRTPRLIAEIAAGRADGRLPRLMRAWARTDVLVLDDFALQPLADQAAAHLLEVIEDRAGLRSTIVTSQLAIALWHENLGEATDRRRHPRSTPRRSPSD